MLLRPYSVGRTGIRVLSKFKTSSIPTKARHLHSPSTIYRQRPLLLASATFGFSLPLIASQSTTHLDTSSPIRSSSQPYTHSRDAKTPLTTDSKHLNPAAVKQISLGSILGLGAGVLVSSFSRTLTLLLGVGIVVVQYAAKQGYNLLPVERVQRYVKGINIRNAINDNVAFKISFGLTFALAAFGEF